MMARWLTLAWLLSVSSRSTALVFRNRSRPVLSPSPSLARNLSPPLLAVETAQLLLDPRRHAVLKERLQKQYSWIPGPFLEMAVDQLSIALCNVAPPTLQQALVPGAWAKMRAEWSDSLVDTIVRQPAVRDLPLISKTDKRRLIQTMVEFAIDQATKDAAWTLAAPEERLAALERQIVEVKAEMGWRRLVQYRVSRRPWQAVIFCSILAMALVRVEWRSMAWTLAKNMLTRLGSLAMVVGDQAMISMEMLFATFAGRLSIACSQLFAG